MCYREKYISEPHAGLPKKLFERKSYTAWSIDEILMRLFDNPFESPFTVIEQFILELDFCIYFSGDTPRKHIFTTAKTTAEDVLDYLLNS